MGFSRCGQYVLSYTVQLEADEHTAYPVHVYRLQWWHFVPLKPLEKVTKFSLLFYKNIPMACLELWLLEVRMIIFCKFFVNDSISGDTYTYRTLLISS